MTAMVAADIVPERQIRALFTASTVTVYQAYPPEIADPALVAGTLVPPFKVDRMTWIKPSFLWMMHRSGWATKPGQERVLAIEITRAGFEWALSHAALSHYDPSAHPSHDEWVARMKTSSVRVQWDPERSLLLQALPWRSIQIGLSGGAVNRYLNQWITAVTDVTPLARRVHDYADSGHLDAAQTELPAEQVYPLPDALRANLGAT
jgi:hypothetical protein